MGPTTAATQMYGQQQPRVAVNEVGHGFGAHNAMSGHSEQAACISFESGRFWPPIHCVVLI
ncbi:hypothetical protein N7512_002826 [Penicillium capsulatum]|nr:hypothetical protein N7512_002826 [Penicillium capsulatum]